MKAAEAQQRWAPQLRYAIFRQVGGGEAQRGRPLSAATGEALWTVTFNAQLPKSSENAPEPHLEGGFKGWAKKGAFFDLINEERDHGTL